MGGPHELERRVSSHGRQLKPIDDQPPPREMASEGLSNRLDPLRLAASRAACLILEPLGGRLLVPTDMALDGGGEASIIGSETKDGCCIARAARAKMIVHALPFPEQSLLVGMRLVYRCLSLAGKLRRTSSVFVRRRKPCFEHASSAQKPVAIPHYVGGQAQCVPRPIQQRRDCSHSLYPSVKPNAPLPARRSELHIELLNLFRLGTRPFDPLDHQRPVHDVIAVGCASPEAQHHR